MNTNEMLTMGEALNKLSTYVKLEEQGLLVKLPFKVDDTVYYIGNGNIEECVVCKICLGHYVDEENCLTSMAEIAPVRGNSIEDEIEILLTDIGRLVFFDKESAQGELNKK